jgi:NADH dehydrogenase
MADHKTHIVVIGAGYAGLLATVRLADKTRHQHVSITLVNASDHFVERLRLHQFAANGTLKPRPIADALRGTGVQFVQGLVTGINPAAHTITVQTDTESQQLSYDKLLYALGSTIDRDSIPGIRDHAYTLTPTGDHSAAGLREVLPTLPAGARLVVCGGGATGIEAAAEFADAYPHLDVRLLTQGELGMFLGKPVAAYMRKSLQARGVTIQDHTTITEVREREIVTVGVAVPYDVCLWAGGFVVSSLARESGLSVNERDQILIDPYMRSISHPDIYAVGDAAYPLEEPGVHVRMSAFMACIMGAAGADSLAATLQGKTPKPFSFVYMGQGIALGHGNAIGFGNGPNDVPKAPYFTGRAGYAIREFFVNFLAGAPLLERRFPGSFWWMGKGRYQRLKAAAGRASQQQSASV